MVDEHDRRPGLPGQIAKLRREHEALAERVRLLEAVTNRQYLGLIGRVAKLEKRFDSLREYVGRIRRHLARLSHLERQE